MSVEVCLRTGYRRTAPQGAPSRWQDHTIVKSPNLFGTQVTKTAESWIFYPMPVVFYPPKLCAGASTLKTAHNVTTSSDPQYSFLGSTEWIHDGRFRGADLKKSRRALGTWYIEWYTDGIISQLSVDVCLRTGYRRTAPQGAPSRWQDHTIVNEPEPFWYPSH